LRDYEDSVGDYFFSSYSKMIADAAQLQLPLLGEAIGDVPSKSRELSSTPPNQTDFASRL